MLPQRCPREYQVGITVYCPYANGTNRCHFRSLPTSSVALLVESLLAQLPEETAPAVIVVKPERPPNPSRLANGKVDPNRPSYDPSMIYILELATILTLRDRETLETLGEGLSIALQSFIRDARNVHPLALSRVVYYLLEQLRLSHV